MSEKPIIFSGEMVRAILYNDRKTVTRRVIKNMPIKWHRGYTAFANNPNGDEEFIIHSDCGTKTIYAPYNIGDMLWVRENWWDLGQIENEKWQGLIESHTVKPRYVATCPDPFTERQTRFLRSTWRKRPSIHMPKWVARIWLKVVSVRVERLQEITREDAISEGIEIGKVHGEIAYYRYDERACWTPDPIESFMTLWNKLNAKRDFPWESNPWVWRIEFKVKEANE